MGTLLLRVGRVVLGVACLIIGVIGLFLPFIQGILFLVIGLTLLSSESDRAKRWLDWLRAKAKLKSPPKLEENDDGYE
ncbi:MAG TPA: PGPGW domain-containing protein [Candidatus Acidoferrales bacterium]|nr:PGPGW domain-containing protein [Candidatus Acidoferrales bacterium]